MMFQDNDTTIVNEETTTITNVTNNYIVEAPEGESMDREDGVEDAFDEAAQEVAEPMPYGDVEGSLEDVEMYGSAGPRDLPDGGPTGGGAPPAVRSGARHGETDDADADYGAGHDANCNAGVQPLKAKARAASKPKPVARLYAGALQRQILTEVKRRYVRASTSADPASTSASPFALSFATPDATVTAPAHLQSRLAPGSSSGITIVTQCSVDR